MDILLNMELPQGDEEEGGDTEGLCNRDGNKVTLSWLFICL